MFWFQSMLQIPYFRIGSSQLTWECLWFIEIIIPKKTIECIDFNCFFLFFKCIFFFSIGWGLNLGYPSILINALQNAEHNNNNSTQKAGKDFELTTEEISWIGLINLLSVTFGCVSSGLLMDPIGKRRLMQVYFCRIHTIISYK